MNPTQPFAMDHEGALLLADGLNRCAQGGVWVADDRILAHFTQVCGGLTRLIYHGKQPQSANATLLHSTDGALLLALQVRHRSDAAVVPHTFARVRALPYGWENAFEGGGLAVRSCLCAQGRSLIWQIQCRNRTERPVAVQPLLRLDPASLNRQVNGERVWHGPRGVGDAIHLTAYDRLQTRDWIGVEGMSDIFIEAEALLAIAGEQGSQASADGDVLMLPDETVGPGAWGRWRTFTVICADGEAEAGQTLHRLRLAPDLPWREQQARYAVHGQTTPRLQVEGYPVAEAAYRLAPIYSEAAKVGRSGALRSSSGGYYFVWGWDSLMAGHELNRAGDAEGTQRLLDFCATHLAEDGSIPHRFTNDLQPYQVVGHGFISMLFISLLCQHTCETLDRQTLAQHYPLAVQMFRALADRADARGFFPCLGMYPDAPEKLGRTAQSLVCYEIGFWYTTCRTMETLARLMGQEATARAAADLATRIQQHFLPTFFDSTRGFLVDAINPPDGQPNDTYPLYTLFPLHNPFGVHLLRPHLGAISRFIRQELTTPNGLRMIPPWDKHTGTETIFRSCWFLHFDLYALKAFRYTGEGAMIERWLRLADDYFAEHLAIPELQILDPPQGDQRWPGERGQIWQTFALSGWTRGLLEGVVGLERDWGGLTYIPCAGIPPVRLHQFPFRGGHWEVEVAGRGGWVTQIAVDDRPLSGSLKIPHCGYTADSHRLEIRLGDEPPSGPCLLEAVGGAVLDSAQTERRLTLRLAALGLVNLRFFCPTTPRCAIEGASPDPPLRWSQDTGLATLDLEIVGEIELTVTLA